jgi:hypothetical protein
MPGTRGHDTMGAKSAVIGLCMVFLFGCQLWEDRTLPPELMGIWQTSAPRYEGASFEFKGEWLIFTNEKQDYSSVNRIKSIDATLGEDRTSYEIIYESKDGLEYQFDFYYVKTRKGGVIQFTTQDSVVWVKQGAARARKG